MGDAMEGVELDSQATPVMSEQELRVCEVYDQLQELQLSIALLRAQGVLSKIPEPDRVTPNDIETAKKEVLEAKALYQVRNNIIDSVLVANPILKSVYGTKDASLVEQDLRPLLRERDDLSAGLLTHSSTYHALQTQLREVEAEHISVNARNKELASTMLELAEEAGRGKTVEEVEDGEVRREIEEVEKEVQREKMRWRIMKGTASATVAASGVDWARDEDLLGLVMGADGDEDD